MIVRNNAKSVVNMLAMACGGFSQISPYMIGEALAGQINNNGWDKKVAKLAKEAELFLSEQFEESFDKNEAKEIENTILERLHYFNCNGATYDWERKGQY